MPKIYFNDLGLRNYFANNFSPIGMRDDKGILLENYVYLLLKAKYGADQIRFWRTLAKQEVDFIALCDNGTQKAFEVKYNKKSFSKTKYASFIQNYPDIPLECLDIESTLLSPI